MGQAQEAQHRVAVRVEAAERVVAAFEHMQLGGRMARGHLAPVQHLVALRDQVWTAAGSRGAPGSIVSSSAMNSGRKKKRVCGSCQAVCSPMYFARSRAGCTAGLISTARQPPSPASAVA